MSIMLTMVHTIVLSYVKTLYCAIPGLSANPLVNFFYADSARIIPGMHKEFVVFA